MYARNDPWTMRAALKSHCCIAICNTTTNTQRAGVVRAMRRESKVAPAVRRREPTDPQLPRASISICGRARDRIRNTVG